MIGITESKLGGRIRRMNFGSNAWYIFCELHKCTLEEASKMMFDQTKPASIRDMVYCGLVASDRREGNEVDYNEWTVGEWIDEIGQEELTRIFGVLLSGSSGEKAGKKKVSP